jgi:hypothetical protein
MRLDTTMFAAVYLSKRPLYNGRKSLFRKELFGYDCRFRFYPAGGRLTLRILKDNPILKELKPSQVYKFQDVNELGFKRVHGTVTDMKTTRIYQLIR